jgi:hypothetical protein
MALTLALSMVVVGTVVAAICVPLLMLGAR